MRTFRLKRLILDRPVVLEGEAGLRRESEILSVVADRVRTVTGADRMKRRRVSWNPSLSPDVVGYRIYWAVNKSVSYDADFSNVGCTTSLILPDDVPHFPLTVGRVEIGITALNRSGNESDMTIVAAFIDFSRPDVPLNLKIEAT
ncbi:MAG: hypothetical protein JW836_11180 [Deltaproteobacteria bacterium]|nr:hypothetical protein [Deltaproteobacteria bacterium]